MGVANNTRRDSFSNISSEVLQHPSQKLVQSANARAPTTLSGDTGSVLQRPRDSSALRPLAPHMGGQMRTDQPCRPLPTLSQVQRYSDPSVPQRPSSRASSSGGSHRSMPLQENIPTEEGAELEGAVTESILRARVRQLEGELLAAVQSRTYAMRGSSERFVGGGQFRGGAARRECGECIRLQGVLKRMKKTNESMNSEQGSLEAALEAANARAVIAEAESARSMHSAELAESHAATCEESLEKVRQELCRATQEKEDMENVNSNLRSDNHQLEEELASLKGKYDSLIPKLESDHKRAMAFLEKTVNDLKNSVAELEDANKIMQFQADKAKRQCQEAVDKYNAQESSLAELKRSNITYENEVKRLTALLVELESAMQSSSSKQDGIREDLEAQLAALKDELAQLQQQLHDSKQGAVKIEEECHVIKKRIMLLEEEHRLMTQEAGNLREKNEQLLAEMEGQYQKITNLQALADQRLKMLEASQQDYLSAKDQVKAEYEARIQELEAQVIKLTDQSELDCRRYQNAKKDLEASKGRIEELMSLLKDAKSALSLSEAELKMAKEEIILLKQQLRAAGGPSTEDWEKLNEQHKKMLQECNDIWTTRMQESEKEAADKIDALNSEVAFLKQQIAELEANHGKAMEEAEARVKRAEQTARKATDLAEQTVQSTLKGKLSVSVLAPSVRVSFSGSVPDMLVVPEAPRTKIEHVLKKEVLPGFCKVFMSESSSVGPEGQDVNVWLTGIMGGMVKAIDDHVTGVLRQANDSNSAASDGSVTEVRTTSSSGRRPDSAGRNSLAQVPHGPPPGSGRRISTGQARMQSVARRSMSQNPVARPR